MRFTEFIITCTVLLKKEQICWGLRSKTLLDADLKMISLDHQNNFVGIKNNEQRCKQFWYSISLSILHNYWFNKSTFLICIQLRFWIFQQHCSFRVETLYTFFYNALYKIQRSHTQRILPRVNCPNFHLNLPKKSCLQKRINDRAESLCCSITPDEDSICIDCRSSAKLYARGRRQRESSALIFCAIWKS